jgi:hypothetical protein
MSPITSSVAAEATFFLEEDILTDCALHVKDDDSNELLQRPVTALSLRLMIFARGSCNVT